MEKSCDVSLVTISVTKQRWRHWNDDFRSPKSKVKGRWWRRPQPLGDFWKFVT